METDLVVHQQQSTAVVARDFMPIFDISQALSRRNAMVQFVQQIMVPGTDFGKIPGTNQKDVLLKPGAEKLCSFFGLSPEFVLIERTEDWTGEAHGKEAFFYYLYQCRLSKNGRLIGCGDGSCNSWESKYRYRSGERKCPQCDKPAIIKGKAEYGGGFICFAKKGGCGAKFKDNDASITGQDTGRVPNPDIADTVNTIQKMAQKRALIAAVLIGVNASDYFTQDIEDMVVIDSEPPAEPPSPKAAPKADLSNEPGYTKSFMQKAGPLPSERPKAEQKGPVVEEDPTPPALQQIYRTLSGDKKFEKLNVYQELKNSLKELLGDEGELKYYEILGRYGVKKSSEFKLLIPAKCAARDLYLAVQKAATGPRDLTITDDDVPSIIGGQGTLIEQEVGYGVD